MDLSQASLTLSELGFSDTEALVYCELLREPGRTGYAVAKALKKSQANVYSSLAALTAKGAVEFANSESKSYRSVPPHELFPRIRKEFHERCATVEAALANISAPDQEDRFYQLKHSDQVFDRAAAMCDRASGILAFELYPDPFKRIGGALAEAAARGVGVAGITFDSADTVPNGRCVLSAKAARVSPWPQASEWRRDQMAIVADASEALFALFDRDTQQVLHAFYTDSLYVASLLHASLVDRLILSLDPPRGGRDSFNKKLFGRAPPGLKDLLEP